VVRPPAAAAAADHRRDEPRDHDRAGRRHPGELGRLHRRRLDVAQLDALSTPTTSQFSTRRLID